MWSGGASRKTFNLQTFFSFTLDDFIDNIDDITKNYEGKFTIAEVDLLKVYFLKVVDIYVKPL